LAYTASNQTLRSSATKNGAPFGKSPGNTLDDLVLTGQPDFRVDAFGVSSYSDAIQTGIPDYWGSVLAHGVIDNVALTVPAPALASSKENGKRTRCVSNLRQLTLAAEMYWDENEQRSFRYLAGNTNGGAIYWFGWIKPGAEGEREFDASYGAIYPYLQGRGVE